MNQEEAIFSKNVLDFVTVSNDFCLFIDKFDNYETDYCLNYLQKVLPLLYLKGSLLPPIISQDENYIECYVTEEHWDHCFSKVKTKLEKKDEFISSYKNEYNEYQVGKFSVAELIADIYQELKDFLIFYQKNMQIAKENSIMQVQKQFIKSWGEKCILLNLGVHRILTT